MLESTMREILRPGISSGLLLLALVACQSGCTTALTTAYLREGLWTTADDPEESTTTETSQTIEPDVPPTDAAPDPTADTGRREAALEEALSRLTRMGRLDPAVEAALVATLQRTQPEDWPVVVEEFIASLPPPEPPALPAAAEAAAVASESSAGAAKEAVPKTPAPAVVESDPAPASDESIEPADDSSLAAADPPDPPATDDPPAASPVVAPRFAVRSACFASAVRAWGDLDRFDTDHFRPGQELIVYVELDHLAAQPSPGGHTTCIAAVLRLLADDRTLHTWSFEPIAETCPSQRRDYFARFVVRIPESLPPADCRVEIAVTDTLTGTTADTTLPLAIVAAE